MVGLGRFRGLLVFTEFRSSVGDIRIGSAFTTRGVALAREVLPSSISSEGERERVLSAAKASVLDLRGARRISPPVCVEEEDPFTEGRSAFGLFIGVVPSTAIDKEENIVAAGSSEEVTVSL